MPKFFILAVLLSLISSQLFAQGISSAGGGAISENDEKQMLLRFILKSESHLADLGLKAEVNIQRGRGDSFGMSGTEVQYCITLLTASMQTLAFRILRAKEELQKGGNVVEPKNIEIWFVSMGVGGAFPPTREKWPQVLIQRRAEDESTIRVLVPIKFSFFSGKLSVAPNEVIGVANYSSLFDVTKPTD